MSLIVLAEDDELAAAITIESLMDAGHAVAHFTDGLQALEAIRFRRPKLVILDCIMPVMGGIEALRILRRGEGLTDMAVLMLTARDQPEDRQIAEFEGADGYLAKPVDPDMLLAQVDELLAKGSRRRVARLETYGAGDDPRASMRLVGPAGALRRPC